ncbi:MAG TPA: NAD(P)/FAD-dependent oxidoreductase [Syntrophorhabdales bacterium]|nr:NAD(P)/FAD-dependent oxidoreductase [Syntrophorhabdales bacterium]
MNCDILIIGGGPAGLWAAKSAADQGFDTVILEEHLSLGHTKHCSGWLLGCTFMYEVFDQLRESLNYQRGSRLVVRDAPSGEILEDVPDTGWGGYLVRRELFDREVGKLAIQAGARLFLNARATSLIREDEQVVGVRTSSNRLPEIRAHVTICADGMKSAGSGGFAARELAQESEAETYSGIQMELVNVMDVTPGVIEIYKSSDPTLGGRSLWPHAAGITLASFSSVEAYHDMKSRTDNLLSLKLSRSYPIYISGFRNRKRMGFYYSRVALPGLLFVGEASGCSGIVHGMMSGYYAAQVASMAIRGTVEQTDVAEAYSRMLKNSDIQRTPFCYRHIVEFYGSYKNWLERSKEIKL